MCCGLPAAWAVSGARLISVARGGPRTLVSSCSEQLPRVLGRRGEWTGPGAQSPVSGACLASRRLGMAALTLALPGRRVRHWPVNG